MYIYRLVTVHTKIIYFNLGLSLQVTEHGGHVAIMRCLCVRKQILSYFRKYFRTFVQSTTVYYGCTQYAATLHSTQLHTLKVPSSKIDYNVVHLVQCTRSFIVGPSQLVYYHTCSQSSLLQFIVGPSQLASLLSYEGTKVVAMIVQLVYLSSYVRKQTRHTLARDSQTLTRLDIHVYTFVRRYNYVYTQELTYTTGTFVGCQALRQSTALRVHRINAFDVYSYTRTRIDTCINSRV